MQCIQCHAPAVAICRSCSAGLCEEHLLEAVTQQDGSGALQGGCRHLEELVRSAKAGVKKK